MHAVAAKGNVSARSITMKRPARSSQPASVSSISEAIKRGIRDGRYAPGQRLIEADLCNDLASSRGAVREALRILAGEGIVQLVPQKGARVRKLGPEDIEALLPVLAGMVHMIFELALPAAAAPRFRARLERAMVGMRHARRAEDFYAFQLAGIHYTDVLLEAAANPYLSYLNGKLYPELFYRQLGDASEVVDWDVYLDHFERLHKACLAGDKRRALEMIGEHQRLATGLLRRDRMP